VLLAAGWASLALEYRLQHSQYNNLCRSEKEKRKNPEQAAKTTLYFEQGKGAFAFICIL
jgi:hypothetical protein